MTTVLDYPGRPEVIHDDEGEVAHAGLELRDCPPIARCHPDRPMHAIGLCADCYAVRTAPVQPPPSSTYRERREWLRGRSLSERELQVLALIADGLDNEGIGDALRLSHKTAAVHVGNILAKLGHDSRVQAAVWYARRYLARFEDERPM